MMTVPFEPRMTKAQMWEHHKHIWNRADKTDEEKKAAAMALHREYYAQFVDEAYIRHVVYHIEAQRLLTSINKDGCFNDIRLSDWDTCRWPDNHRAHMQACGDTPMTYPVCEAKEAARIWYEREIEKYCKASMEYNFRTDLSRNVERRIKATMRAMTNLTEEEIDREYDIELARRMGRHEDVAVEIVVPNQTGDV